MTYKKEAVLKVQLVTLSARLTGKGRNSECTPSVLEMTFDFETLISQADNNAMVETATFCCSRFVLF
jgi:hypothetical protein